MSKPGAHKKKYDAYKSSGNRERNKKARQEKAKRRSDRFAKRREDGKGYEYSKDHAQSKLKEAYGGMDPGYFDTHKDRLLRELYGANVNSTKHTDLAHTTSEMRKMKNMLDKIKMEEKKKQEKGE